jgi:hypothetical protein
MRALDEHREEVLVRDLPSFGDGVTEYEHSVIVRGTDMEWATRTERVRADRRFCTFETFDPTSVRAMDPAELRIQGEECERRRPRPQTNDALDQQRGRQRRHRDEQQASDALAACAGDVD